MQAKQTINLSLIIASLFASQVAFAQSAGKVTFIAGEANITHADKTVTTAVKNSDLNAGDTIETKEGRLQLSLIDGGKVSLQPNTIYKINKYEFATGKEDGSEYAFTELIKGGLRTVSGLIGHKNRERYQLKTTVATIGIRGTEFTVNFNDNNLLMTTNHGSVDVCNQGGCLNALSGQSIAVAGVGASPKPSSTAAKAAAAAPAGKAVFAASDTITNIDSIVAKFDLKPASTLVGYEGLGTSITTTVTDEFGVDFGIGTEIATSDLTFDKDSRLINLAFASNSEIGIANDETIHPISFNQVNSDDIIAWGQSTNGNYFNGTANIVRFDYIAGKTPTSFATASGSYKAFGSTTPYLVDTANNTVTSLALAAGMKVSGQFNFDFNKHSYDYVLNIPTVISEFALAGSNSNLGANGQFKDSTGSFVSNSVGGGATGALSEGNIVQGAFIGEKGERIGLQYGFFVPELSQNVYGSAVFH